jgi:hypothetical protein
MRHSDASESVVQTKNVHSHRLPHPSKKTLPQRFSTTGAQFCKKYATIWASLPKTIVEAFHVDG